MYEHRRTTYVAALMLLCLVAIGTASSPVLAQHQGVATGRVVASSSSVGVANLLESTAAAVLDHPVSAADRRLGVSGSSGPLAGLPDFVADPSGLKGANSISTIFADGFEVTAPAWGVDGHPTWARTTYRSASGSWSAYCAGSGVSPPGPYANNMSAWLVAGPFSLTGYTSAALLFKVYADTEYQRDHVKGMVSIDGENFYGWAGTGDSHGWLDVNLDLTNLPPLGNICGRSQVWIAFIFRSDASGTDEGAYVDNIALLGESAPVSGPDDDIPGVAIPASPFTGSIAAGSDWDDVFRIPLSTGQTLQAGISGPTGSDFRLYLYAPGTSSVKNPNTPFAAVAAGGNYPRTFKYTADQTGTFYLDAYAESGSGGYSVTYAVTTPAPPDTTPPHTTVSTSANSWSNDPVTLTFTATDPGANASGLDYTTYRIDGGSYVRGTAVTVAAPSGGGNDGIHSVSYYSVDRAGNAEAPKTTRVMIDTVGPKCAAKNVTVMRGKVCKLVFYVGDELSAETTTVLRIREIAGGTRKTFSWGYDVANEWYYVKYRCALKKGTYRIEVTGRDLAGNEASEIGRAKLAVR